jgi:hypothetical protein
MTHKRTQRIDNSENADNANTKREMHKGSKNQKLRAATALFNNTSNYFEMIKK